jgi:lipoprotein NlpI
MKCFLNLAVVFALLTGTLGAQERQSIAQLRDAGHEALQRGDRDAAAAAADALVRDYPNDPPAMRLAGDFYLRAGKARPSIQQFKRYIERVPEHTPELWQYGIALAIAGDYQAGQKQFELHRTVNPHDVENALWHFYCVAKAQSPQRAMELILPAPGDQRVPMEQLLWLYRVGGNQDETQAAAREAAELQVRAAVDHVAEPSRRREHAEFYADLYLAMHADAWGNRQRALELAAKAAEAKEVNYMTDVGRVYYSALREAAP